MDKVPLSFLYPPGYDKSVNFEDDGYDAWRKRLTDKKRRVGWEIW